MKKRIWITCAWLFALLISACFSVQTVAAGEADEDEAILAFLKRFEKGALAHDTKEVLKYLYPPYLEEQCYGLHKGDVETFLNEFFFGESLKGDKWESVEFTSIEGIVILELEQVDWDRYIVTYKVRGPYVTIRVEWSVIEYEVEGERVYGLEGAYG